MEFKLVISFWQVCAALVVISSAFGVNTYMTRKNEKKVEEIDTKMNKFSSKAYLTEEKAREIFPSKETTDLKYQHIEEGISELKEQNKEILTCLRRKDV